MKQFLLTMLALAAPAAAQQITTVTYTFTQGQFVAGSGEQLNLPYAPSGSTLARVLSNEDLVLDVPTPPGIVLDTTIQGRVYHKINATFDPRNLPMDDPANPNNTVNDREYMIIGKPGQAYFHTDEAPAPGAPSSFALSLADTTTPAWGGGRTKHYWVWAPPTSADPGNPADPVPYVWDVESFRDIPTRTVAGLGKLSVTTYELLVRDTENDPWRAYDPMEYVPEYGSIWYYGSSTPYILRDRGVQPDQFDAVSFDSVQQDEFFFDGTITYTVLTQPSQRIVCNGQSPRGVELSTALYNADGTLKFVTENENAMSWGFLFYSYGGAALPGTSFVCINNPLGLNRTVPFQSDAAGRTELDDVPLFPGTWYFQRVHRENTPGWGNASSGSALEIIIQ